MKLNNTNIHSIIRTDHFLIAAIMIIGTILRFWNFPDIPYMHDELSALSRLQFDDFSDLIKYGVMLGDTHPAGVHVFLYYWSSLVGFEEQLVKLPFILAGIISIWLSYSLGKLWFDSTTGLLTATMIASTQFFVMYSQIARPYISGLFLTLLMVYFWSLYFYKERKIIYLLLFVVFAAASAYNHHFSLLFAAIVGISGVFLLRNRKDLVIYLSAGVLIFILYLPHLNIFISQLSQGGIGGEGGWLAKPRPTFFLEYLDYLMQFSLVGWISFLGVTIYLIFILRNSDATTTRGSKRWLLVCWFLLPIIIGYTYSVLRNPVIQYSMLIFSTPYIYMLIFSFNRKVNFVQKTILISVLLTANIWVLAQSREHYRIFYHQPYEELFKTALLDNADEDVFVIDDCIAYYHDYYFQKYNSKTSYYTKRDSNIELSGFIEMVGAISEDIVVTHALTSQELQIVRSYFPYQIGIKKGFTYDIYTFSRSNNDNEKLIQRELIAENDFYEPMGRWKDMSNFIMFDSISSTYVCELNKTEWGPSISFNLDEIASKGMGIIDIEMRVRMDDTITKALLVSSIIENDENIYWNSTNFEDYKPKQSEWTTVFLSVDIQNCLRSRTDMEGLILKINVWNPKKANLIIDNIKIHKKQGNPERYALYRKLIVG